MNTFTVDSSLQQSLSGLSEVTELRDSYGRVIGYFSPASPECSQAAAYFNPEEMKRRKESAGQGLTTVEVLEYLKSLET